MFARSVSVGCFLALAALTGCGGDNDGDSKPKTVAATVHEYFATQNEPGRRCQLLSASTRERYGGGPDGPGCEKQFVGSGFDPPKIAVKETAEAGKRGCVRFATKPAGGEGIAVLVKESTWKVDHFETAFEPRSSISRQCRDDASRESD